MSNWHDVPNSQIEQAILNTYKREKERAILRDRFIGGMTYEAIIQKHYPESDWWGRADHNRAIERIKRMVGKIQKALADKEGT